MVQITSVFCEPGSTHIPSSAVLLFWLLKLSINVPKKTVYNTKLVEVEEKDLCMTIIGQNRAKGVTGILSMPPGNVWLKGCKIQVNNSYF
jgi:hypothetical protein